MRIRFVLSALAATVALGGCGRSDVPTAASTSLDHAGAAPAMADVGTNGFDVTTLRLQSDIGGGSSMFGVFQALVGTFYPSRPCVTSGLPAVQSVAVCAEIHNPGGETLTGGTLELIPPGGQEAVSVPILMNFPPSPCLNYLVAGSVGVGFDVASGTTIAATFTTSTGSIHTIPAGRPLPGDFIGVSGTLTTDGTLGPIGGDVTNGSVCTVTAVPLVD